MGKHNCRVCGCELIPGENWDPSRQKGHHHICRNCKSQYNKQYRKGHREEIKQYLGQYYKEHKEKIMQHHKERKKEIRQYDIKHKYGLFPEEYNDMLEAQHNRCAICRKPFIDAQHAYIDHNHSTGVVRGILCHNCNTILGHAHDDPKVLRRAADYLENANKGVNS